MADDTTLPNDLFLRVRQIMLPLVTSTDDRDLLLTEAFYLVNPLLYGMSREGSAAVFCTRSTKTLIDFGCLTEIEHALARLLTVVRTLTGVDKHDEIDDLIKITNAQCVDRSLVSSVPLVPILTGPAPVQSIATPRAERRPTVFVSYSHKDAEFAKRLIADLSRAGHACWIDTVHIKSGDEWIQSISEGINNSYAFVSVVSVAANTSTWVRREFLWAEHKKKLIIPVMAEPCDLEIYLMDRQILTLHDDYNAGLEELLRVLPPPYLPDKGTVEDRESIPVIPAMPPENRRGLELDYLEYLRAEVLFDLEKYTPLGGESQIIERLRRGQPLELAHMRPEFEHLIGSDHAHPETRRFENAVEEILVIRRAVLLGEPGSGKTTTLLSLAGELAAAAQNDPIAQLPMFLRLGRWTDPDQELYDFIIQQLGPLGAYLPDLIDAGRAVLLLDGMNEIPVSQRRKKYLQIQEFITHYPDWIAVASCRARDYTIDLQLDEITITPLDALRVREFVTRYLGPDEGEALFWKIVGVGAYRFEVRFKKRFADRLDNWETVFWLRASLPDGVEWKQERINTYYYSWSLWRALRDAPGSLMQLARNPYMLSMLTQVYGARGDLPTNRGELFHEFVETLLIREQIVTRESVSDQIRLTSEADALLTALAALAYEMQVQRGQTNDSSALTVLPLATARQFLDERLLYLSGSTSILELNNGVRFTHQLLQEYFAATYMDREIGSGQLVAADIWPPDHWWERTNWEEAVILLAGLYSDDCSRIVEWVNVANPEVAAMCVARSGAQLAATTRDRLWKEWANRLTDVRSEPEPLARAAVGRALGLTRWDNRPGVATIVRNDVRLPDIDWVEIPAGEFIYQKGQRLYLDTFHISRYLVTYGIGHKLRYSRHCQGRQRQR